MGGGNKMNFFDEKKDIWLKIFKVLAIIMFFLIIIFGLFYAINIAKGLYPSGHYYDGRFSFGIFLSVFLTSILAAIVELAFSMILIDFFTNIRELKNEIVKEKRRENQEIITE